MDFKIEQEGLEELDRKMKTVTFDMKRKGGRFALRKAAQVVRDAAKENARRVDDPATPNSIADNITERWNGKLFKRTENLGFRIGVRGGARSTSRAAEYSRRSRRRAGISSLDDLGEFAGAGSDNPGGDTFYWRFIEFGTSKMSARPFMRPALDKNIGKSTDEFVKQYKKALDRAIKRGQVK